MTAEPIPLIPAADAEALLISAVLNGANIADLTDVKPTDFSSIQKESTWAAMLRMHEKGIRPELATVRNELKPLPEKMRPSDIELFEWYELNTDAIHAPHHAETIIRNGGINALRIAASKIQQITNTVDGSLEHKQEAARTALDAALKRTQRNKARYLADVLPTVMDTAQTGKATATPTEWPDLNNLIGGIAPGRLIVIGARPGVGKSVMCCNLASHIAGRHQLAVHFATLEMSEEEVAQRIVAAKARVDLTHLTTGGDAMSDPDWNKINAAWTQLESMPLIIDDTPTTTVTSIRAAVRETQRTHDDLALVVVDYLQLIDVAGRENRAAAFGDISRQLKILAKETNTCVVAAAQLNRESVRESRKPRMSDLRESGAIEADADQIVLLHRPSDDLPEVEAIVGKNRHGPRGSAYMKLWGHYSHLVSAAKPWQNDGASAPDWVKN